MLAILLLLVCSIFAKKNNDLLLAYNAALAKATSSGLMSDLQDKYQLLQIKEMMTCSPDSCN